MSTSRTVVILGASDKPERISNLLLRRLRVHGGFEVVPVHPALEAIDGVPVRASLAEVAPGPDLLTLYVGPERSAALEADIVALRPAKVIFNPGAENPRLEARLNEAGIATENACSLVLLGQGEL
jgi:predicted CoA-binding protein